METIYKLFYTNYNQIKHKFLLSEKNIPLGMTTCLKKAISVEFCRKQSVAWSSFVTTTVSEFWQHPKQLNDKLLQGYIELLH